MFQQVLTYWLISQALGLIGLGWARRLFHGLPDRGYAFAKALGLLLSAYLAWLMAMLGLAPFGRGLVLASGLAVCLGGLLLLRKELRDLGAWLRANWQLVLFYELLFGLALSYMALQRSYEYNGAYPHPWGTERAMDFAFFNAIRTSSVFPPHDPWMAGLTINYYYFGYLMMAAVSLVSGLHPSVSYNLSLALVFALTALGVAGIVLNLIRGQVTRGRETRGQGSGVGDQETGRQGETMVATQDVASPLAQAPTSPGDSVEYPAENSMVVDPSAFSLQPSKAPAFFAALLSVLLVLFAANQGGALQVISGTNAILALDGPDMGRVLLNGLGARQPVALAQPFSGEYFEGTTQVTPTDKTKDFDWWQPSRGLWGSPLGTTTRAYAITEFPLFSFWLGDMHPHVMAMPFMLLAAALALHTLLRADLPGYGQDRHSWLELLLAGIVIGSLYTINSWDYPTFLLLVLGALLLRQVYERGVGLKLERSDWYHYAIQAFSLLLISLLLFLPFFLTFKSLVGAKEPLVNLPILGALSRTVGLVVWTKTPIHTFLIIFGLFLIPLLGFVAALRGQGSGVRGQLSRNLGIATGIALILGLVLGFPLLVLLPLAGYIVLLALRLIDEGRRAEAFVLWAFALVCLVVFGTEVIYLRDVFNNRMNTIFKFYYQAWLLLGTLGGYAVWWLVQSPWSGGSGRFSATQSTIRHVIRLGSLALFLIFLAGALVYPWLTIGQMFTKGNWYGLQGKTPAENPPGGEAAIAWIRANTPGESVILEAAGGPNDAWFSYQDFSAVSASTGRATVMGWPGHENQWRAGDKAALDQIQPRRLDVVTIYSTSDLNQARELLNRYKVNYIYIGPMERSVYPPEGIAKLTHLGQVVFQEGEITIVEYQP